MPPGNNLIHFAFAREQPVWLQQGLNTAWGLPKADQGTGMDPDEAHGLHFPAGDALAKYCRDVAAAIGPQIEAMSDEDLQSRLMIKPQGDMPRYAIIAQIISTTATTTWARSAWRARCRARTVWASSALSA